MEAREVVGYQVEGVLWLVMLGVAVLQQMARGEMGAATVLAQEAG